MNKPVPQNQQPLTPNDIRRIREGLGLTQVEAGELLGGGLRAFQKYESGAVSPASTTANLLRLLEANPGTLETLTGKKAKALEVQGLRPFEVSGGHVAALSDRKFVALLRRLLTAESLSNNIPRSSLHVASNITAPDGGEDARIAWTDGPERTDFLPGRTCLLQLKASDTSPGAAAKDVLRGDGTIEPAIYEVLSAGGFYLLLCNRSFTHKQIAQREQAVRQAITDRGLAIAEDQICFRDADQMASWVNAHPAVAIWVLEQTQPGLGGPFRTWSYWAGRHEHERVPFVEDPRFPDLRAKLRATLSEPRTALRLVGLSGVGKSRLALEALGPTDEEDAALIALSHLVLYVDESDAGATAVRAAVQTLADLGVRAVVAVDRCPAESHQALSGMVKRSGSKLSLLTIDHEIPAHRSAETYLLEKAPPSITEGILKAVAPGLRAEDQRRLVRFADGYPQLAAMVGEAWLADIPVATATDSVLIDRVIVGRQSLAPEKTVKVAMLVSALSLLGIRGSVEHELAGAAPFSGGLTPEDLKAALEELRLRGVVQLRGRYATLEPRPIAAALAERQWRIWGAATWDELLAGEKAPFASRLSDRLTLLNDSDIAHEVARHLCRYGGPLDSFEAAKVERNAEVISNLAEIDAPVVADLLDRVLAPLTEAELRKIAGSDRRHIVHAVEKIAFRPDTFEEGARLMMVLALAENETWGNNATGQFCSLFPLMLAETAADGKARLGFLDAAIDTNNDRQLLLIVDALSRGATTGHFSRMMGSESHGLRPALQPWLPATMGEARDYIQASLDRLLHLAIRNDAVGEKARHALATEFRLLVSQGFLDFIEKAISDVTAVHGRAWPDALASLGLALNYDLNALEPGDDARIRSLVETLTPNDIVSRVRLLVTEMPWDYPCDGPLDFENKEVQQREAIERLVDDLLKQPSELAKTIPQISVGGQRMAVAFGRALAERAAAPLEWRWPILMAYRRAAEKERNADLLAGFYIGLNSREPGDVASFKRAAMVSSIFAPIVPFISLMTDIPAEDVELVRGGLKSGKLPLSSLHRWSMGGVLAKLPVSAVAPLFSDLLAGSAEAWDLAANLMGMYVHSDASRLNDLRPQLRELANESGTRSKRADTMSNHHFVRLMTWILKQGREDEDARAVALSLTRIIVAQAESGGIVGDHRIKPLIPILLRDYPETVWSLISKAIVADPKSAWRFEFALGDRMVSGKGKTSALLNLSPDTLFAWCHAYPEVGPAFLSVTTPLLVREDGRETSSLHPIIKRLIDEFGEREDVQRAIARNIGTFGWVGSMADYYRQYIEPFTELSRHSNGVVRRWARRTLEGMKANIESTKQHDDERGAFDGD